MNEGKTSWERFSLQDTPMGSSPVHLLRNIRLSWSCLSTLNTTFISKQEKKSLNSWIILHIVYFQSSISTLHRSSRDVLQKVDKQKPSEVYWTTVWPPVELLHLLAGPRSGDAMVTLAAVTRPLPGRRPVHMVHIENSAMAVDTSFPVFGGREAGGRNYLGQFVSCSTCQSVVSWHC